MKMKIRFSFLFIFHLSLCLTKSSSNDFIEFKKYDQVHLKVLITFSKIRNNSENQS